MWAYVCAHQEVLCRPQPCARFQVRGWGGGGEGRARHSRYALPLRFRAAQVLRAARSPGFGADESGTGLREAETQGVRGLWPRKAGERRRGERTALGSHTCTLWLSWTGEGRATWGARMVPRALRVFSYSSSAKRNAKHSRRRSSDAPAHSEKGGRRATWAVRTIKKKRGGGGTARQRKKVHLDDRNDKTGGPEQGRARAKGGRGRRGRVAAGVALSADLSAHGARARDERAACAADADLGKDAGAIGAAVADEEIAEVFHLVVAGVVEDVVGDDAAEEAAGLALDNVAEVDAGAAGGRLGGGRGRIGERGRRR